jgi:hypothetical protein
MDLARFIAAEVVPENDLRDFSRCVAKIVCDQNGNTEK